MRHLNRRDFLRATGRAGTGAALASLPFLAGCKGSSTTPKESVPVDLQFDIYNHTQGFLGSFTKTNVISGSSLLLNVSNLISDFSIHGVDPLRICVRSDNLGGRLGYSRLGSLTFNVPNQDQGLDIFLFNDAGAIPFYDWQDALSERWNTGGRLMVSGRKFSFYRRDLDGVTGEERVWGGEVLQETGGPGVFDQLNDALAPPWAPWKYANWERQPDATSGYSSYGYGMAYGHEYASYSHDYVVVNPTLLTTIPRQVAGGLGAMIQTFIGWGTVLDEPPEAHIQTNGVLNQVGKDYLAYLFVQKP